METAAIRDLVGFVAASVAGIVVILSLVGAMKAGVLRQLRIGSFETKASPQEREEVSKLVEFIRAATPGEAPFETQQLALYYAQILTQSKISFWFSLIFASIGFGVIIVAVFLSSTASTGATIVQFVAGVVIDAVAALFFVQSRNAQKSMGEFFDKLRRDRQHLEARKLCDAVENRDARDSLRINLSVHYAEISNAESVSNSIVSASINAPKANETTANPAPNTAISARSPSAG